MTKLKQLELHFNANESIIWITETLRMLIPSPQILQEISLHISFWDNKRGDIRLAVGEQIYQQWMSLDSLLIQICKSQMCMEAVLYGQRNPVYINHLLPKMMEGGFINVHKVRGLGRFCQ